MTVTGAVAFLQVHVNQMQQQGIKYAVTCKVMEDDGGLTFGDDFCFLFQTNGQNTTFLYPPVPANRFGNLRFSQRVASSLMNQDDTFPNYGDEVYALLMLWASFDGGRTWTYLSGTKTNQQPGRY